MNFDFEADADAFLSSVFTQPEASVKEHVGRNEETQEAKEEDRIDDGEDGDDDEEEESGQLHPSEQGDKRDQAYSQNRKATRIHAQTDPGQPNISILLHGLNYSTTQESLLEIMKSTGANLESINLVLDKQTGRSRGFAFCKFYSLQDAKEWMHDHLKDPNDPFIIHDFIPKLEFCRDKVDNRSGYIGAASGAAGEYGTSGDWHCFSCASKNFTRRDACFRCGMLRLDSDRQIRDLEVQDKVNQGMRDIGSVPFHILLFRNVDPLTSQDCIWQTTRLECSPTSIWLVRDRKTRHSLGHCFVKFDSVELANKLLNKIFKSGKDVKPFYIENRMIEVSYAHMGSFIPSNKISAFACLVENGTFLSYWDASAFCRPYPADQVDAEIPPLPSIEEYMAAQDLERAREEEEREAMAAKEAKRKQKNVVSTKMSIQLQRWNAKQKEIGDLDELMEVEEAEKIPDSVLLKKISSVSALNDQFSDLGRICCLLPGCRRKFKSIPLLTRHQKESAFHAQRMRIHRRTLVAQLRSSLSQKSLHHLLPKAQPISRVKEKLAGQGVVQQPTRHGIQEDNKGNQLLQKLGWEKGSGLGVGGEGIRQPIKVVVNSSKKGIGASVNPLVPRALAKPRKK